MTADGREHSQTFSRKADAEAWLNAMETSKVRGEWIDPARARRTVGDGADEWLATTVHLKPKTREGYESNLRVHVLPRFENMPIGAVDQPAVRRWVADMVEAGRSPSVIREAVGVARRVIAAAVDAGAIRSNPCDRVKLP